MQRSDLEARLLGPGSFYQVRLGLNGLLEYVRGPRTLFDIYRIAAGRPSSVGVINDTGITPYNDLLKDAMAVRDKLVSDHKISVGQRVAIIGINSIDWIVAFLAVSISGATPVLLPSISTEFVDTYATLAGCVAILVTDPPIHGSKDLRSSNIRIIDLGSLFNSGIGSDASLAGTLPPSLDTSDAIIVPTSGTSGLPKLTVISQRAATNGLMNMMLSAALNAPTDKAVGRGMPAPLAISPLSHISGYAQLLLMMLIGGNFAITQRLEALEIAAFIQRNEITAIAGMDVESCFELLALPNASQALKTLRFWNWSGARTNETIASRMASILPNTGLSISYGLTETSGGIASKLWNRVSGGNSTSSGRIVPTAQVRFIDTVARANGVQARAGRLHVRGNMLMSGYIGNSSELVGLDNEGWFDTGDIGFLDENDELVISERPSIGSGVVVSRNTHLAMDIERLLLKEDYVLDAATIYTSSGEMALVVVPTPDCAQPSLLRTYLENILRGKEIDARLFLLDSFPRTLTGKAIPGAILEKIGAADCNLPNRYSSPSKD